MLTESSTLQLVIILDESIRRGFSTAQRHDLQEGEARLEQHIHQLTDVANIREQVYVQTQGAMEGKQMVEVPTFTKFNISHMARCSELIRT